MEHPAAFLRRASCTVGWAAALLAGGCHGDGGTRQAQSTMLPSSPSVVSEAAPAASNAAEAPGSSNAAVMNAPPALEEQPPLPIERAVPPPATPAPAATPAEAAPVTASNPVPATEPTPAASGPITVFLAGDSTVMTYVDTASASDQAGWGQMLGAHLEGDVSVDNRAIGGRTARRFIDEGRLDDILEALQPGDYLLVQFGTNDGNRTATYELGDESVPYFLDPATDFKAYLQEYVDGARQRGATPVLVTPPPRNSAYCTGGNGTGAHAQAMRELGQARGVSVVDLNAASVNHLKAICPAPTPEDFFLLRADGSVDGTHFQENGARILAGFVANGLREAEPALAPSIH